MKAMVPTGGALTKRLISSVAAFAAVLGMVAVVSYRTFFDKQGGNMATVTIQAGTPFSFDPMDYDAFTHHLTQRPVLVPLVSNYKSGNIIGVVAKGWSVSEDQRVWTFQIRNGLRFANGDTLDGHAVVRSLVRIAFLMKKRSSTSGFLDRVLGYNDLRSIDGFLTGLVSTADGREVRFEFAEPAPDVPDKLSFGLYAIAHQENWHPQTGVWKDPKSAIASGPYTMASWSDSDLVLNRRADFPLHDVYQNQKPFDELRFVFGSGLPAAEDIDVVTGLKGEPFSPSHEFRGEANNGILFVRLMGHRSDSSAFRDVAMRRRLRSLFYKALNQAGLEATRSFLPLSLGGVTQAADPEELSDELDFEVSADSIRICDYKAHSGLRQTTAKSLMKALQQLGAKVEMVSVPPPDLAKGFDERVTHVACDAAVILTGILLADPLADLRFMVRSAEGIRLPDPTNQLKALVQDAHFDLQAFNQVVWDDALAWPVMHTTAGLWLRSDRVDLAQVNLSHPPSEPALFEVVR